MIVPKWRVAVGGPRSVGAPAIAEGHKGYERHKGRWSVVANLKVGKTIKALANLTIPLTP